MKNDDFEIDEKEFKRDFEPLIRRAQAAAGPCPHPDLLMAAVSGVVFENSEQVLRHLNSCPTCRQLNQDLMQYDHPGVSKEEDRRIRARWAQERGSRPAVSFLGWLWQPFPMAAAAAIVLIAVVSIMTVRNRQTSDPNLSVSVQPAPEPPAVQPKEPAANPILLALEKAPIKVAAASVLIYRSDSVGGKGYLDELAAALQPYRADNYAEAARRLEALSSKFPESPESHFYLGVSRLFLKQHETAFASLETAARLSDETLRDDITWYRALALERLNRQADAVREMDTLCARAGDYKAKACSAVEDLKRR